MKKSTRIFDVAVVAFVSVQSTLASAAVATVTASPVPELSDYLAMAFVAITGGFIVYRTYKRNAEKA